VSIWLFEAIKSIRQTLANNLTKLLNQYGLGKINIAYAKNEGSNLNAMTIVVKSIMIYVKF
jgi:hypothetical protein